MNDTSANNNTANSKELNFSGNFFDILFISTPLPVSDPMTIVGYFIQKYFHQNPCRNKLIHEY